MPNPTRTLAVQIARGQPRFEWPWAQCACRLIGAKKKRVQRGEPSSSSSSDAAVPIIGCRGTVTVVKGLNVPYHAPAPGEKVHDFGVGSKWGQAEPEVFHLSRQAPSPRLDMNQMSRHESIFRAQLKPLSRY